MRHLKKSILAVLVYGTAFSASAITISTDVITLMDESGSMAGEQAWFSGMITSLDSNLALAAGSDPYSAQFGVVGFGGNYVNTYTGTYSKVFDMDTSTAEVDEWGSSSQASAAGFVASGGFEDGYDAIDTALGYSLRADAVTNLLLVTDEDRDYGNTSLDYNSILSGLSSVNALLNAVLDIRVKCSDNSTALGVDSDGTGYVADGSGSFTTCEGATVTYGYINTIGDYVDLAFATGGAVWDLNQLRLGGNTATSFTEAFIDVKVQETINRDPRSIPINEPSSIALFGLGAFALGALRRRKSSS